VSALQRSTEAAKSGNMCLVIAPEGTRSTTGQLREFKKGQFSHSKTSVVGVVDLSQEPSTCGSSSRSRSSPSSSTAPSNSSQKVSRHATHQPPPPLPSPPSYLTFTDSWINTTGRVHIRYLKPILASEASSRQEMLLLVRRRMLEAFKDCPPGLGKDISSGHYFLHLLFISSLLIFDYTAVGFLVTHFRQTMSLPQIALKGGLWSVGITVALYVYYTYLVYMWPLAPSSSPSPSSASAGRKTD
jgi:hypothetical protein